MTKQEFKVAFDEVLVEKALAPIPNQGVSLWSEAQAKVLKRLWREARSTSEMPELLVNAFSTKLLDGYKEHTVLWPQIFDYMTITKKDVDLPGLKGIHVWEISSDEYKKLSNAIWRGDHYKILSFVICIGSFMKIGNSK